MRVLVNCMFNQKQQATIGNKIVETLYSNKVTLENFALPRDYVVFLSSGVYLTVKCPQGKSPQARGSRVRGTLKECLLQVRVRDYPSAESVCVYSQFDKVRIVLNS